MSLIKKLNLKETGEEVDSESQLMYKWLESEDGLSITLVYNVAKPEIHNTTCIGQLVCIGIQYEPLDIDYILHV